MLWAVSISLSSWLCCEGLCSSGRTVDSPAPSKRWSPESAAEQEATSVAHNEKPLEKSQSRDVISEGDEEGVAGTLVWPSNQTRGPGKTWESPCGTSSLIRGEGHKGCAVYSARPNQHLLRKARRGPRVAVLGTSLSLAVPRHVSVRNSGDTTALLGTDVVILCLFGNLVVVKLIATVYFVLQIF